MTEGLVADDLPTPIALTLRRCAVADSDSADYFLATSYVAEAAIKCLGVAMQSALAAKASEQAYRMAYSLLRADGLGEWEAWIRSCSTQPIAGFLPPSLNELLVWLTSYKAASAPTDLHDALAGVREVFLALEIDDSLPERRPTFRDVIAALVQIRNKTKAHGAVGPNFFATANAAYARVVTLLLRSCPLFSWRWLHLSPRDNGRNRGLLLRGATASHIRDAEVSTLVIAQPGIHFWPPTSSHPISCGALLRSDRECSSFLLPNGRASAENAEFLDYGTGRVQTLDITAFARVPAALPPSETHGLASFDIQANVFGNLPALPPNYVARAQLEAELERRLRDRNHPIITLHGRGGIGKTSVALKVAHALAAHVDTPFDCIVWFSARDVDLKATGPKDVRPSVIDLATMSRQFGDLFERDGTVESFARALQAPTGLSEKGILFICDNFETLEGTTQLHEFLDTHTHLPNKVLITSRERAFKADFPIEVVGMTRDEVTTLMQSVGRELAIEALLTPAVIASIYEYSEGHPYVIRVVLGEIAKEGRYVPASSLLPRRLDIVETVFERSFNRLSESGRRVFLTVANWRSAVSELALLVILGERGIDVEEGIDECVRLSLLEQRLFLDDQPAYVAPQLARLFGRKKLQGDADRLVIQEDLQLLQRFGVVPIGQPITVPQDTAVQRFLDWALDVSSWDESPSEAARLDGVLLSLAELWPKAWLTLARYRLRRGAQADVAYALRRAVEEMPMSKEAHLERAVFARTTGDEALFVASRLRAIEIDPEDVPLLRDVAFDVCKYINEHSVSIPKQRRSVYLTNLRSLLEAHAEALDATGLSRLAWLFLLEDNRAQAWKYASRGLLKEQDNRHCYNIIQRLRDGGFNEEDATVVT